MKGGEMKICGLAAVRARFKRDASSIVRLYFDHPTSKRVGVMCRTLAAARKVYRCVEPAELERIADTVHHGGIVAVVEGRPPRTPTRADVAAWARRRENVVVLDHIGNAHNLGAIARTAGYFAVPRMVISGDAASAQPGTAAYRVAEGGLEALEVWSVSEIAGFLRVLSAAGFDVVGAASSGGAAEISAARHVGPWALVLGNEERGLSPEAHAACNRLVTIPGRGPVESLNVSVAAAIIVHELSRADGRRQGPGPQR
jgi:TrmH RNA methyltransferase